MLSNDDFRAFLRPRAPRSDSHEVARSQAGPKIGYKHAASFAVQRLAAEAVALVNTSGISLRSSHALSKVPAHQRRAVFACAMETLKTLPRLAATLRSSTLGQALRDDLVKRGETHIVVPEEQSLALACVLLHDLLAQRWLDRTERAASQILNHRSDLVARFQASPAASFAEVAHGNAYLIFARVNTLHCSVDEAVALLQNDGWVEAKPFGVSTLPCGQLDSPLLHSPIVELGETRSAHRQFSRDAFLPDVLVFPPGAAEIRTHSLIKNSTLVLQDRASCAVAHALSPRAGVEVIDACAAPGKKTSHLAALLGNKTPVYAFDADNRRVERMRTLLASTSSSCVKTYCADFMHVDPQAGPWAQAEAIILDPSCSGSGTTFFSQGHDQGPETSGSTKSTQEYADSQLALLRRAMEWPLVQSVVYSTCSVEDGENEGVVARCLAALGDRWKLTDILQPWPHRGRVVHGLRDNEAAKLVRFDPCRDLCLGFFIARFDRRVPEEQGHSKLDEDAARVNVDGIGGGHADAFMCVESKSISNILDNLATLVRRGCTQPSLLARQILSDDDSPLGIDEGCESCSGVDPVSCDEFIEHVEGVFSQINSSHAEGCGPAAKEILLGSLGSQLLDIGILHQEPLVVDTCTQVIEIAIRRAPGIMLAILKDSSADGDSRAQHANPHSGSHRKGRTVPGPLLLRAIRRGFQASATESGSPILKKSSLRLAASALQVCHQLHAELSDVGLQANGALIAIAAVVPVQQLILCINDATAEVAAAGRQFFCAVLQHANLTSTCEVSRHAVKLWLEQQIPRASELETASATSSVDLSSGLHEGDATRDRLADTESAVALVVTILELAMQLNASGALDTANAPLQLLHDTRVVRRCLDLLPLVLGEYDTPGIRERLLSLVSNLCDSGHVGSSIMWHSTQCACHDADGKVKASDAIRATHFEPLNEVTEIARRMLMQERGFQCGALRLIGACRASKSSSNDLSCIDTIPPPVALLFESIRAILDGQVLHSASIGRQRRALHLAIRAANSWAKTAWSAHLLQGGWVAVMLQVVTNDGSMPTDLVPTEAEARARRPCATEGATRTMASRVSLGRSLVDVHAMRLASTSLVSLLAAAPARDELGEPSHSALCSAAQTLSQHLADTVVGVGGSPESRPSSSVGTLCREDFFPELLQLVASLAILHGGWILSMRPEDTRGAISELSVTPVPFPESCLAFQAAFARVIRAAATSVEPMVRLAGAQALETILSDCIGRARLRCEQRDLPLSSGHAHDECQSHGAAGAGFVLSSGLAASLALLLEDPAANTRLAATNAAGMLLGEDAGWQALLRQDPDWLSKVLLTACDSETEALLAASSMKLFAKALAYPYSTGYASNVLRHASEGTRGHQMCMTLQAHCTAPQVELAIATLDFLDATCTTERVSAAQLEGVRNNCLEALIGSSTCRSIAARHPDPSVRERVVNSNGTEKPCSPTAADHSECGDVAQHSQTRSFFGGKRRRHECE